MVALVQVSPVHGIARYTNRYLLTVLKCRPILVSLFLRLSMRTSLMRKNQSYQELLLIHFDLQAHSNQRRSLYGANMSWPVFLRHLSPQLVRRASSHLNMHIFTDLYFRLFCLMHAVQGGPRK